MGKAAGTPAVCLAQPADILILSSPFPRDLSETFSSE